MATGALAVSSLVFAESASAAPPGNDNFANATTITGSSGSITGTTVEATGETGEPAPGGTPVKSIWYSWVAPSAVQVSFDTCTSSFDTTMGAYTGTTVSALTAIATNDQAAAVCSGTDQSRILFTPVSGATYKIKIDGYFGTSGTTKLTWSQTAVAAPANDNFANAIVFSGASGTVNGTNVGATGQTGEPANTGAGTSPALHSVWYKYTPTTAGTLTISLCTSSSFDSVIGLYTGTSVSALTSVVQDDDGCGTSGGPSKITSQTVAAGTAYNLSIDGYQGATSAFTFTYSFTAGVVAPPANDNFANAVTLTGTTGTVNGTNVGATAETGEPLNAGSGPIKSVWYKYTPTSTGTLTINLCASTGFDSTVGLYTGAAVNALTKVASADDGCGTLGGPSLLSSAAVTAGTAYSISVDGYNGATSAFSFTYTFALPAAAPANDNLANAIALPGASGSVTGTTVGATAEAGEVRVSGTASAAKSVWYSWVAPSSGSATFGLCTGTTFDTLLAAYTGSAYPLTLVASNDDTTGCGSGSQSRVTFNAVAGTSYKIQVDGFGTTTAASGPFTLTYSVAAPLTLAVNDVTANEGNTGTTSFVFTVSLSAAAASTVTVNYATADQTATAPSDYASTTGSLSFTAGQVTKTITVPVVGDTTFEPTETFAVNLTTPVGATLGDGQGIGTITNDDGPPAVAIGDVTQVEGNTGSTTFTFPVTLSNASSAPVSVNYATADGSATAGSDYTATTGSLAFTAGQVSKTVTVTVQGDTTFEDNETFVVNLSGVSGGTIADAQGVGTISNDDAAPTVSIDDVSHAEGDAGTTVYAFTLTLSNPSSSVVTVDYATADTTASSPSDYTAVNGTRTFNPGETSKTVTVLVNGDSTYEVTETFAVNLTNAAGSGISDSTGVGTIVNDDAAPAISIGDVIQTEGSSGTTSFDFEVTLTGETALPVTVDYSTNDLSAESPSDFAATSGTLTFAPGTTTATISVQVNGDLVDELNEAFSVTLTNATNSVIADDTGLGSISDDDPAPVVSIDDVTGAEGQSGTSTFDFTVTLSGQSSRTVTVDYATSNGTATAPSDYTNTSGTLTFAPGQTSATISVVVIGDTTLEPDETFSVDLTAPFRATLGDSSAIGTIVADEVEGIFSIDDVTQAEGDAGTTAFTFTVTRSGPNGGAATVSYATSDGTAEAPGDYTATSGTLTFAPGATTRTVTIDVAGDLTYENDESFSVELFNAAGAAITDGSGVGTIVNDDAVPSISIADLQRAEGNSGITGFGFTVTLSNPSEQIVSVDYATVDGSATSPDDFASTTGTLTFLPGQTSKTATVGVVGDATYENDEDFSVELSSAVNAGVTDGTAAATITNDDSPPSFAIDNVSHVEGDLGTTSYVFTVTLTGSTALPATVGYSTADGTATLAGGDYAAATGTLTFAPGDTSKTITVVVNGDGTYEPDEAFGVVLSGASNATVSDGSGVGTITNDDAQPAISITNESVSEGDNGTRTVTFDVTLSGPSSTPIAAQFTTVDGTATSPADFAALTGTVTFAPGVVSQTIAVTIKGDVIFEGNELFTVVLSAPTGATIADATGVATILDDDPTPSVSVADVSTVEGNTGTHAVTFTVALTNPSAQTITANFTTSNGTAVSGEDYVAIAGSVTFNPGETSKNISVLVNGDTKFEADESFTLTLSGLTNASPGDLGATATITNDDVMPTASIASASTTEGNTGTKTLDLQVTLSNPTYQTVTVNYTTNNGTATAPSDFVAGSGSVTFTPGQTSKTVSITINGDTTYENNEVFGVDLTSSTNAGLADSHADATILNDDSPPSFSISDATRAEGDSGTSQFTFTVTLAGPTALTSRVDYATVNGTATAPSDYVAATPGTLSFAPGQTTQTVVVLVNGDLTVEPDETFTVVLSGPDNATIADSSGIGTIQNDDNASVDLRVTLSAPAQGTVGSNFSYTAAVTNIGTQNATGVTLTDTLPTGLTLVNASSTQGSCSAGAAVSCAIGNLAPSATATVTIAVRPTRTGTYTNTVNVTASEQDSNPANNQASATTNVVANAAGCTIIGTAGDDTISGTAGPDTICGGDGNDRISGLGGNDTLRGEGGTDGIDGGPGNDTIDGGTGANIVSYDFAPAGVVVSLTAGSTSNDGQGGTDTLTGITTVRGSAFNDQLTGSAGNDRILGLNGNDAVVGNGGDDYLDGGPGTDNLNGGQGTDRCLNAETRTACEQNTLAGAESATAAPMSWTDPLTVAGKAQDWAAVLLG